MNKTLRNILQDLGLTENEAAVYFAAMSIGPSTIAQIADSAETKRTTVYSVVDSLLKMGLMRIELKGWKKFFVAESPEKLEAMLERKRNEIKKYLPDFIAFYNLKESGASIKYFEGLEGVKSVYDSLLRDIRPHEDYMAIGDLQQWLDMDQKFFSDFILRRAKTNADIRILMQDVPLAHEHKQKERNFNERIKIMPKNTSLSTNLVIIPQRVVIHQFGPPVIAIVIENKSIIKMHRELFEIIWSSLAE